MIDWEHIKQEYDAVVAKLSGATLNQKERSDLPSALLQRSESDRILNSISPVSGRRPL